MSEHISDPDFALVEAMAGGEVAALNELYIRHGANILNYLTSLLRDREQAEEVLQDVMFAAWEHASGFRGESKVRTWLLTIARHRAINTQRRAMPVLTELDESASTADTTPLEKVERKHQQQALQAAILQLPPFHQEILVLIFYHQLSGPEVAEVLGITVGTVKSRLHRAKEMLRRVLQSMGETYNA
ncbi:MAG: sigma-70 family RNA polymerase sigma factor [Chloroflexota bacterium]